MTAVVCANAAGDLAPTLIIFKGKRVMAKHTTGWPEAMYTSTENGYMENEIWESWCSKFVEFTNPTADNPVVLIADQHDSRHYMPAVEYLTAHHVRFLVLPPHTTHILQPLDVGFFGPFKMQLRSEWRTEAFTHERSIIVKCVKAALDKVGTVTTSGTTHVRSSAVIKAFSSTGIWPYNPGVVTDQHLAFADDLAVRRMKDGAMKGLVSEAEFAGFDPKAFVASDAFRTSIEQSLLDVTPAVKAEFKKAADLAKSRAKTAEVLTGLEYQQRRVDEAAAAAAEEIAKATRKAIALANRVAKEQAAAAAQEARKKKLEEKKSLKAAEAQARERARAERQAKAALVASPAVDACKAMDATTQCRKRKRNETITSDPRVYLTEAKDRAKRKRVLDSFVEDDATHGTM